MLRFGFGPVQKHVICAEFNAISTVKKKKLAVVYYQVLKTRGEAGFKISVINQLIPALIFKFGVFFGLKIERKV